MYDEELDRIRQRIIRVGPNPQAAADVLSEELERALRKADDLNHMVFRLRAEIKGLNAKLDLVRVSEFQ